MKPVALVTGAARRVGRCVATELAARGYRLVIHANRSLADAEQFAEELSKSGAESIALEADLRDHVAIDRMIEAAAHRFGRIDVLVNSAAIWHRKPLEQVTAEDVLQHFTVNTLAVFLCCQKVGLLMCRQMGGGVIVNIGDWAIQRPYVDYAAYFPSKGAIPTLTRTFAVELARRNPKVRVNAVLPGPVLLPKEMSDEEREAVIAATLVHREGSPKNIAQAITMLIENDYITGVCLPVDGGRTIFDGTFEW